MRRYATPFLPMIFRVGAGEVDGAQKMLSFSFRYMYIYICKSNVFNVLFRFMYMPGELRKSKPLVGYRGARRDSRRGGGRTMYRCIYLSYLFIYPSIYPSIHYLPFFLRAVDYRNVSKMKTTNHTLKGHNQNKTNNLSYLQYI